MGLSLSDIDSMDLSDFWDYYDAARAIEFDDQISHIRSIQLSRPISEEHQASRQAQLNELSISRDRLLMDFEEPITTIFKTNPERNRQHSERIGKIQRAIKKPKTKPGIKWRQQQK